MDYNRRVHPLLEIEQIDQPAGAYLNAIGCIFAVFDERTQDSGNVSYGVRIGGERYFVKTAGDPEDRRRFLSHSERVSLLRNAVRVSRACGHPAVPRLYRVIEAPGGPLLVYQWLDGERLGVPRAQREDPRSSFQRFRSLPVPEITRALDVVYELHDALARSGWTAVDFYDGSIIYDFARRETYVVDLDSYRDAPSINDMGRMFGSTRFMAPEEFERGAPIDQRTNVFTMGRTAAVFLSNGTLERSSFQGCDALYEVVRRACQSDRRERFASVTEFFAAWRQAA